MREMGDPIKHNGHRLTSKDKWFYYQEKPISKDPRSAIGFV